MQLSGEVNTSMFMPSPLVLHKPGPEVGSSDPVVEAEGSGVQGQS